MHDFIVRAENLSKQYRINTTVGRGWRRNQRVLVEDISNAINLLRQSTASGGDNAFWALKDVSFEAKRGDTIGIIGRNGAGKSTLLKLLSRITEPTHGRAILYGRVGSLLEVGTGFHSELTGRENIFISGSILGMSRAEIKEKFDEIVDFSGVEKFLDTPIKRFSSGMEVRLAFSVAVHLNPQILLLDEVLSVGDAAFQEKSMEKIREISAGGATILFVSHNLSAVSSICNKALVLDHGRITFPPGSVKDALEYYQGEIVRERRATFDQPRQAIRPGEIRLLGFEMMDENGVSMEQPIAGRPVSFLVLYEAGTGTLLSDLHISILIKTPLGEVIANLNSKRHGPIKISSNRGRVICTLPTLPISPSVVNISLILEQNGQILEQLQDVFVGTIDGGEGMGDLEIQKQNTGNHRKMLPHETNGFLFIETDWFIEEGS